VSHATPVLWIVIARVDGTDTARVVKEGPMHGKLIWSHDPGGSADPIRYRD